jgi:uncharacterized protein (TIGR00251 family)
MITLKSQGDRVTFAVHVQPRASKTVIRGEMEGALRLALAAPPVDGAANTELVRFFARLLDVQSRHISIIAGSTSKKKVVAVTGRSVEEIRDALAPLLPTR